ncbi:hypothetical protein, partial [Streptomyces rapamycinicus]|uniref:hypothetical protein n=1 Tax=Streptomyces rapamycinicus TaxID=1226757 RepID=UPI001AD7F153
MTLRYIGEEGGCGMMGRNRESSTAAAAQKATAPTHAVLSLFDESRYTCPDRAARLLRWSWTPTM